MSEQQKEVSFDILSLQRELAEFRRTEPYKVSERNNLRGDVARLLELVNAGREYAEELAAEWAWKRNSIKKNNSEMAKLDAFIAAAKK